MLKIVMDYVLIPFIRAIIVICINVRVTSWQVSTIMEKKIIIMILPL